MSNERRIVNLPLCYWLVTRMTVPRLGGWIVRTPAFHVAAMVLIFGMPAPAALISYLLCLVPFIAWYELGYLHNDVCAAGESEGGTVRHGAPPALAPFIASRLMLGAGVAGAVWVNGSRLLALWLVLVLLAYAVHNVTVPRRRIPSFVAVKVLQAGVPVVAASLVMTVTSAMLVSYALVVALVEIVPLTVHYATKKIGPLSPADRDALLVDWLVAAQLILLVVSAVSGEWALSVLGVLKFAAWVPGHLVRRSRQTKAQAADASLAFDVSGAGAAR